MNKIITLVEGSGGEYLSSVSSLDELLRLVLRFKEDEQELADSELYAVRLWILKKACFLESGETVSLKSKTKRDLVVSAGRASNERVFVDDSDDVMEAKISDIYWL